MASYAPITITASATLDDRHVGTTVNVSAAAGLTLTLPAATGTGRQFDIVIHTTVTSNNVIVQVANSTDVMQGTATFGQDAADTTVLWETAATSDTITMNGTTKGGVKGDRITLTDVATGFWEVVVIGSATGTEVTPFSAAV